MIDDETELCLVRGALALRRECGPSKTPVEMLRGILKVLRTFIPFDIATYVEFKTYQDTQRKQSGTLALGRFAVDGHRPFSWPARWLKVSSEQIDWVSGETLYVPDMQQMFQTNAAFAALRDDPIVRIYFERKVQSFVVSVLKEKRRPVCSLTLACKHGRPPYNEADQTTLERLGMPEVLALVRAAYQEESTRFHHEIRTLFADDMGPFEVARRAVVRLCEHFRWDYVAIFRVVRARRKFGLIEQHNASKAKLLVKDGYEQSFDVGVLAKVLSTRKPVRVEDVTKDPDYKRISRDASSCLLFPVMVNGDVEWILDCESSEKAAFQEPDEIQLGALIKEAEKTLTLWFEMHLNAALLNIIDEGVVVVDEANKIERWNRSAAELLGFGDYSPGRDRNASRREIMPRTLRGRVLTEFSENVESEATLRQGIARAKPIKIKDRHGNTRQVVVTSCDAASAFHRRIWRMSNPEQWKWIAALEYMRTTVQEVAQQTRGPLLLANVLVNKACNLALDKPQSDLKSLLETARKSLAKTDITYERLAASLETEREPLGNPVAIDIRSMLGSYVKELSEADQDAIRMSRDRNVPAIWADPARLRYVFNSTIGYLLAARSPGNKLDVKLAGDRQVATLTISGELMGVPPTLDSLHPPTDGQKGKADGEMDRLTQAKSLAYQAATQALSSVRRVIEKNGGSIDIMNDGATLGIAFSLPSIQEHEISRRAGGQHV